jgi:hypothetical protein
VRRGKDFYADEKEVDTVNYWSYTVRVS